MQVNTHFNKVTNYQTLTVNKEQTVYVKDNRLF